MRKDDRMVHTFTIPGKPFGKARPRAGRNGIYNPKSNEMYEAFVRDAFMRSVKHYKPIEGPVKLEVTCWYQIPKRATKHEIELMATNQLQPLNKPDIDNCIKSIMDGLNGVAYFDDKQVVAINVEKYYTFIPHVDVTIIGG